MFACFPPSWFMPVSRAYFFLVNFNTCLMWILMIWLQWHNYIIGMYCACCWEGVWKVLSEWRYINRIIMIMRLRMRLMRKWLEKFGRNGHLWKWAGSISFALMNGINFTSETEAPEKPKLLERDRFRWWAFIGGHNGYVGWTQALPVQALSKSNSSTSSDALLLTIIRTETSLVLFLTTVLALECFM